MSETPVPEYLRRSMVERVARAICRQTCDGDVHICDRDESGACKPIACRFWMNRTDVARAAIEAMKAPNLAMRKVCSFEAAEVVWPAMIDAALTSPSPAEEG